MNKHLHSKHTLTILQLGLAPGLMALLLFALHALPEPALLQLNFQRHLILNGEIWRLISANFVHSNVWHLLLNLGGFSVLWLLHHIHFHAWRYIMVLLATSLLCSLLILYLVPELDDYIGLSGSLHAMVVLGALYDIRAKMMTGWLLLALTLGKVAYEQWQGPDPELAQLIAANVAIDAHLYGVISGILLFAILQLWRFVPQKRQVR
ncbi:MAG: rhombosortase [Alkalimonas sp.]|nr:rhombosortase [Alkalimonas sp.]